MTNTVPTKMKREQLKQLGEWQEAAEKEVKELTARLGKLTEQLTAAQERFDLIKRLMHLSENKRPAKGHSIASTQSQKSESRCRRL